MTQHLFQKLMSHVMAVEHKIAHRSLPKQAEPGLTKRKQNIGFFQIIRIWYSSPYSLNSM